MVKTRAEVTEGGKKPFVSMSKARRAREAAAKSSKETPSSKTKETPATE